MKFVIITHAEHKCKGSQTFAYEPYVREMNLWGNHVSDIEIVAPLSKQEVLPIEKEYNKQCTVVGIPMFDVTSIKNTIRTLFLIPTVFFRIFKAMKRADHIHLRCPGNVGFLGGIVQILFPNKPKTAKYAGNWDPKAKQPVSYKIQKWILSNTFLTRNMKVLVYGNWENQSKNIIPFFTATYSEKEIEPIEPKILDNAIKFIFVGALAPGKQPLLSVKIVHELLIKGHNVSLDIYGEGVERVNIEHYILENNISETIHLHGNVPKQEVKIAFKKTHFLVFISKSEGWPKVVAEAMCLGCLPISTRVSCVPYMLANGDRGSLVNPKMEDIVTEIEEYIGNHDLYKNKVQKAFDWSSEYTLEKFENSIKGLLFEN